MPGVFPAKGANVILKGLANIRVYSLIVKEIVSLRDKHFFNLDDNRFHSGGEITLIHDD